MTGSCSIFSARAPPAALAGDVGRGDKGDARDQVAKAVGVSGRNIGHGTKVLNPAVPEPIKIEAKVVHHARAVTFQLAEVAVPRALFAAILERIDQLRLVPGTG
jgi:hypothetical protein